MKQSYRNNMQSINRLANELDAIYHRAALKFGMADSTLFVLYQICDKGEKCLLGDIYGENAISKQTVNSALRKMESEGILYLEAYKGKSKLVCLTEKGREYAAETALKLLEAEEKAFGDWSEEEVKLYISLMEKYNESLNKQIDAL